MRRSARAGFTLVELVCGIAIFSFIGLSMAHLFQPHRSGILERMVREADFQRELSKFNTVLSEDFRSADPDSVQWLNLPSTTGMSVRLSRFDFATGTNMAPTDVEYRFRPNGAGGTGDLLRIVNTQESVILSGVDAPDGASPLFNKDLNMKNIVIVHLSCRARGLKVPWIRRIAVKA